LIQLLDASPVNRNSGEFLVKSDGEGILPGNLKILNIISMIDHIAEALKWLLDRVGVQNSGLMDERWLIKPETSENRR